MIMLDWTEWIIHKFLLVAEFQNIFHDEGKEKYVTRFAYNLLNAFERKRWDA